LLSASIKYCFTEKFKNIQWQKKEEQHHPGSKNVHLRYMAKKVDEKCRFVVKVPSPPGTWTDL